MNAEVLETMLGGDEEVLGAKLGVELVSMEAMLVV